MLTSTVVPVSAGRPLTYPLPSSVPEGEKQPLQTFRAYNVAHRGSNGEFPEETAPAYMRAIEEGADFIESDIQATKDGILVCNHDVTLDDTTDVAERKEFADRRTTYEVQWVNTTGWFVVDFTLEELKTLRAKQRYDFRDQQYNGLSSSVKWSDGKKLEDRFVEILQKYGYTGSYLSEDWLKRPAFIQSFAPSSLVYISNLTDLPKVFLIDDVTIRTEDTNQTYNEITSDSYFNHIKDHVMGIGPWKDTVVPPVDNYLQRATDLIAKAHALGLQVHPYTFRNENSFLHFDFHQDPYIEYDYWINKMGVDGLFTDFTGSLHRMRKFSNKGQDDSNNRKSYKNGKGGKNGKSNKHGKGGKNGKSNKHGKGGKNGKSNKHAH
ncbi:hypothetical protein NL676_037697 [Syzygium grande]|nr:hypothetical protein NL676_037697 [Syzygium grande]